MNAKHTIRRSATELKQGRTNLDRLRRLSDDEIAAAVRADADTAATDLDWTNAELIVPAGKKPVSFRLDDDIIAYFKAQGPGYQTRINAVLRQYVEHKKRNS